MEHKKSLFSKRMVTILIGIFEILFAVLLFINFGIISSFFTFINAYLFGSLFCLVSIFLLLHGIFNIFNRGKIKIFSLSGIILLFLGLTIGISQNEGINLGNFFSYYNDLVKNISSNLTFNSIGDIFTSLNGGFIGYFLLAIANTIISPIGSTILSIALCFLGAFFLLINPTLLIVKRLSNLKVEIKNNYKEKEEVNQKNNIINNNREISLNVFENEVEEFTPRIEKVTEESKDEIREEVKENPVIVSNTYSFSDPEHEAKIKVMEEKKKPSISHQTRHSEKKVIDSYQSKKFDEYFAPNKEETIVDENIPYVYPSLDLLKEHISNINVLEKTTVADERAKKINECFRDFDIGASVVSYTIGPSVTRFDVKLNHNVKTSALNNLEKDLGVRLAGNKTVRIETLIEGKDTCGVEVGNPNSELVSFKDCMRSISNNTKDKLLFPLGKDISGNVISCKLDDMPHLLIAGTTGSGKSVFIHNIITCLIMRNHPDELKLMLIDPKRVEFIRYQNLPHLLCPIITSTSQGTLALKLLVQEMEDRYDLFAEKGEGAASYKEYLEICSEKGYEKLPIIVMVLDEFADFMSEGDKETAKYIQRLAQKARACGIYMIISTQRPSAKVITGEIKANIPSRIALSVSSSLESRIIIDEDGAENLLGKGDLLARVPISKSLLRVQSAFIENKEIYNVCEHIKKYASVHYNPKFDFSPKENTPYTLINDGPFDFHEDELYEAVKSFVIETKKCSTTKIQNAFKIGFARADGLLEALEEDGIIIKENNKRVLSDEYLEENFDDEF